MEGVRRAFGEARASLPHVPRGTWAPYEELLLPRSMRGDRDAQRALVERFVGPLRAAGSGDRLVATVFALARTDFVLKATAEVLGVHISTLRHRLERIEDLLGVDLHDPEVRLRLRVAAYLRDLEP
jgi:purine catabolism regulator